MRRLSLKFSRSSHFAPRMAVVVVMCCVAFGCSAPTAKSKLDPIHYTAVPAETRLGASVAVQKEGPSVLEASGPQRAVGEEGPSPTKQIRQVSLAQPGAQAEPTAAAPHRQQQMDLETLLAMAVDNNPSIAQAQAAFCKAVGIRQQVGLKPNPSIGYFGQEIGNDGAGGQHGAFVSQTVVRGHKLQWNRSVLSRDVQALQWQLATQRQRVATDVRIQYFRALAAQHKLERARAFRHEAAAAAQLTKQRYEAAEGTLPDLLQSEMLVDQIDLSIRASELEWQAAWGELAANVGLETLAPLELAGEFPQNIAGEEPLREEVLFEELASQSPLLHSARARVDRARSNLQRQRNQVIPNVNAQAGVGFDDSTGDTFANLQLALPLPVHNQNQGNIAAAQAQYSLALRELERLRMLMRRQLAGVMRRLQTADATVQKYQQSLLPKAERSLKLVEEALSAGETNFLRVLTARQAVFELEQNLIGAKAERAQAASEIEGLLLSDGLSTGVQFDGDAGLRGQALSGQ